MSKLIPSADRRATSLRTRIRDRAREAAAVGSVLGSTLAGAVVAAADKARRPLRPVHAALAAHCPRGVAALSGAYFATGNTAPTQLPQCTPATHGGTPRLREGLGAAAMGGALGYVVSALPAELPRPFTAAPRIARLGTAAGAGYVVGHCVGHHVGQAAATALIGAPGCDARAPLGPAQAQRSWLALVRACEQTCGASVAVLCFVLARR